MKNKYNLSYTGIFLVALQRKAYKKLKFFSAIIIALAAALFIGWIDRSYEILKELLSIGILIFPSLLGFSLGGLGLIIGLSSKEFVTTLSKPRKNKDFSLYEELVGIFSFSVLMNGITLLLYFFGKIGIKLFQFISMPLFDNYVECINTIFIFIYMCSTLYSLFLSIDTIATTFSTARAYTLHLQNRQDNTT